MILLIILILIAIILLAISIAALVAGGTAFILVFGDLIVCIVILICFIKWLIKK